MSDLKVTDRRWWVNSGDAPAPEEPKLKPTYIEELESRLEAKDKELQDLLGKYRSAADEFDQARARLRKEVSKDVERGRRAMLVSFLEVLDNLDRAIEAAGDRDGDPFVQGVSLVRQQFLQTLAGFGVERIDPLGQPFDPARHEAVSTVAAGESAPDGHVCGVIKPGYLIGEDVLRPAMVAVARA
ncbi:MAG TPA: nucleotide exchange factor GrpE [Vicinamibacterales bacterium]|nr:nucleotide exchange factor GrpE [Vicinamibacterales bacterium]